MVKKKTYTKKDLARSLSKTPIGLSIRESEVVLNWFVDTMGFILAEGEVGTRIEIRGLGTFNVIKGNGRLLPTPMVPVDSTPDKRKVRFRVSKVIARRLKTLNPKK